MCTFYSRKWIIKAIKFYLENSDGLARTLLKRCYLTTIIWYAKMAPTRRKFFIVFGCANSHPANPPADIPITPQEYKPGPDVSLKHDDLYARAWATAKFWRRQFWRRQFWRPYIIEKVLPNNIYLVRKKGTNKTQVLHRMRMRQFTPRQPPSWHTNQPNSATPPNSTQFPEQSDVSTKEMWKTPETAHECSPENFPQTEEVSDVTDTYPDIELDVEISPKQPNSGPTNPRISKCNLRHNPKTICNDD